MGGGDKCLKTLAGRTILSLVIERLGPQVGDMALNANGDPARFADTGLPVLPDSVAEFPGPLAGVLAGLDWAAEHGATHVASVAADSPFFPHDLVERLSTGTPPVLARSPSGRQPTFGLWPVALREDLRTALKDGLRKVVLWTDAHGGSFSDFPDDAAFFNINTPEDLAEAESRV